MCVYWGGTLPCLPEHLLGSILFKTIKGINPLPLFFAPRCSDNIRTCLWWRGFLFSLANLQDNFQEVTWHITHTSFSNIKSYKCFSFFSAVFFSFLEFCYSLYKNIYVKFVCMLKSISFKNVEFIYSECPYQ